MSELTPTEIVAELNRFIIGQHAAKRAVAVALRNRWRRRQLEGDMRNEVYPKNILMLGPTGVGKTEIARRLARLAEAPFVKVEATKFTEVGYHGHDVDSIMRDLVNAANRDERERQRKSVRKDAMKKVDDRLLDALVGDNAMDSTREAFRKRLHKKEFEDKVVNIEVEDSGSPMSSIEVPMGSEGSSMVGINIGEVISKSLGGRRTKQREMTVKEARTSLLEEEADKLLDDDAISRAAVHEAENNGIVFIDEIDKVCDRSEGHYRSGGVSREGVQRDLLPLIEGTTVNTRSGPVRSDHVLFIASGAFHLAKPKDLLPELQGRLPIRVELSALTEAEFSQILTEPDYSLAKQYQALLGTEGLKLEFKPDGVKAIAEAAAEINRSVENIGARRLHTVLERLLEDLLFDATERKGKKVVIDGAFVADNLKDMAAGQDIARYIL